MGAFQKTEAPTLDKHLRTDDHALKDWVTRILIVSEKPAKF